MATKSNKTTLTPKQKRAAQMLANPEFKGTVTKLCEDIGVARSTFYDWIKLPLFRDYLTELIESYADAKLSRVWQSLIEQCLSGNVRAIELYFKLKGRLSSQVQQPSAPNNLLDILQEDDDDDMEASEP